MLGRLRVPLIIVAVVVAIGLVVQIVVGLAFGSNVDDARKYGEVDVPGEGVVRLPAGSLDISLAEVTGNALEIPSHLSLAVTDLEGRRVPVTRDVGGPFGGNGPRSTVAYRRIWKADIPHSGGYRVTSSADTGDRVYTVEFGHAPLAIGAEIWKYTGLAALAALAAWLILLGVTRLTKNLGGPS